MDEYEQIRSKSDRAARALSTSSLTQFAIAGLVLLIAIGGAIINFNLIALPMSEMVGGASYIGPYKTSDVAGLVIISGGVDHGAVFNGIVCASRACFPLSVPWMTKCAAG